MVITVLRAIFLGILQGVTEFVPISSSGHLIVVPWLFGWNDPALISLSFDVALHLGTLVAVLGFFAADWVRLIRAGVRSIAERKVGADPERRLAWFLVLGSIPGAIVGALAESRIEELFHQPNQPIEPTAMLVMAGLIALMGALLYLADHLARHLRGMSDLTLKDALLIGTAQAAAIFPGVSRSGATITAGLALGLKRDTAAKFSFLLSAPIIAGAGLKSLFDVAKEWQTGATTTLDLALFAAGFAAAAISGYLCIKYLLRYLQRHSTDIFVFYRWGLALVILVAALVRG
jgi:undecaprenyl-diphosphatase